ncbi:MAG: HAD-IIIC family phosphatase [Gemmatimonadota bacterium]
MAIELLARVDPTECRRILLTTSAALDGLPLAARRAVLDLVVGAVGTDATPADLLELDRLVRRYGIDLSAEAVAGLVQRLRAAERPQSVNEAAKALLDRRHQEPALIRAAIELARERGHTTDAHRWLTKLGEVDPALSTVTWIQRIRRELGGQGLPAVRVALLSSFTIDQVVPYLDLECRRLGLEPEIYLAPFDTWAREVLDPAAKLRGFEPDVAFLSVSIDDLIPELAGSPSGADLEAAAAEAIGRVTEAATQFSGWSGKPLVVHALHSAIAGPRGILEGREGISRSSWIAALNERLAVALRALPRCYLLDLPELLLRSGVPADVPKLRHLAAMRIPPAAMPALARAYVRYVAPEKGLTRKCVVLDLDNTLWGGVVGEDGPTGIRLGHTSPGAEYVEFQRFLATLPERGFLLAIASKNNPDDALEVIRGHEAMILREEAFSAIRINWRPKPENLTSIAEELNIGVDSLIFVDDNPDERELMRQLVPQVLTVEMPRDPALYRETLEALPQLQALAVTAEDRQRIGQYRANRQREQRRVSTASLDEYLLSLEVTVEIGPVTEPLFARVAQLFQRTNQFNVTTRRYDVAQLQKLAGDPAWRGFTLKAGDRFGDHGLVAVALARVGQDTWTVDSFLMSCRVIGYGIETALLATISAEAAKLGASALEGEFIVSKKNVPARDIYERHGFIRHDLVDGVERWRRDLADGGIAFPPWIGTPHDTA